MQADRRALNITLNSIGTELTRDDRRKLYSNFGLLYPHGQVLVKRNCPAQHEYTACQPDAAEWWAVAVCLHLLIVCSARGPQAELALAEDFDQIRSAMEKVPPYSAIFTKVRRHGQQQLGVARLVLKACNA
jgi:V-type H+-transporting ATPase subunit d